MPFWKETHTSKCYAGFNERGVLSWASCGCWNLAFFTHTGFKNLSSCLPPGYLQVSSLGWQPSVWEVSSFLVLTTKLAAFCWNLAESAPESEMAPPFKKGPCCEKSFPSSEQLSSHLNNETQCGSPVPLGLQHGGHVFRAAGWLGWRHWLVCQSWERKWCPQRYFEHFFPQPLNK